MIQILLGLILIIFLSLEFIKKRIKRKNDAVIVYDSRTLAGRLSSLGLKSKLFILIVATVILATGLTGYSSFHRYSEIKELINQEQYLEAESKIDESRRGIIPLYNLNKLEYNLSLNWASSAIKAGQWNAAVIQIRKLKNKDSIPEYFMSDAFLGYYEYINSLIPFKDKRHFDQCGFFHGTSHTYLEYLKLFNVDSLVIRETYELFEELKEINSIESNKTLVKVTHDYHYIKSYLNLTNDSDFVAQEYLQNPEIILNLGCKDTSRREEREPLWDSVASLEMQITDYCLKNNLTSLELLVKAGEMAFEFNYIESYWVRPKLKLKVEKAYLDLLENYKWGEADFRIETAFLTRYLWMENDNDSPTEGDKRARVLKSFFVEYPFDELIEINKNISNDLEKVDSLITWENRWAISEIEFNYLHFRSFYDLREQCLRLGNYFRDDRQYDALYWYDIGLNLNDLYPYHNSEMPHYYFIDDFGAGHLWMSEYYYYVRANTKWNIKPYGAKLGYCDDLRKSLELGFEEVLSMYIRDCN